MESFWNENGKRVRQMDWPNPKRSRFSHNDIEMEDPGLVAVKTRKALIQNMLERQMAIYKIQERNYYPCYKTCELEEPKKQ